MVGTDERQAAHSIAEVERDLLAHPTRWLVTGAAGFIGSHVAERLLELGQSVVGMDNFATGSVETVAEIRQSVGDEAAGRFTMIEGDIRDADACRAAVSGASVVIHLAALGSVARSFEDPETTNSVNVGGFLNVLIAAREARVDRFVYASSSSVYGDDPRQPRREGLEGRPLSPYAVTKVVNEAYADVFRRSHDMPVIGLRFFNVFGSRQRPDGAYAAVIPRWITAMLSGRPCVVNGDGETSRDFCYVANAVQACVLAARGPDEALGRVYNIGTGRRTTLNALHAALLAQVERHRPGRVVSERQHGPFRPGEVNHSEASIELAAGSLCYRPTHDLDRGLDEAMPWYLTHYD